MLTSLPPSSEHGLLVADTPEARHDLLPPPNNFIVPGTRRSSGRGRRKHPGSPPNLTA